MSCNCRHLQKLKNARVNHNEKTSSYMDYNAITPADRLVLARFQNTALQFWTHPSSPHLAGLQVQEAIEEWENECITLSQGNFARADFCRGSSHALFRIMNFHARQGGNFMIPSTEHNIIFEHMKSIEDQGLASSKIIDVDSQGKIRMDLLEKGFKNMRNPLLIYSPVNHETGAVQDCSALWDMASKHKALIFADGAQSARSLAFDEWLPYCHGACMSGQKIYGIPGNGILFVSEIWSSIPDEKGTPDAPGAAAFTEALSLHVKHQKEQNNFLKILEQDGLQILNTGDFDFIKLSPEQSVPGVICLSLPQMIKWNKTMEDLFFTLNKEGIYLSRFSACSSTINGESRILKAMTFPSENCTSSLRISLGKFSKRDDFYKLKQVLNQFFNK